MKKIISCVLCAVMLFTVIPFSNISAQASAYTPRTTVPDTSNACYYNYSCNPFYTSGLWTWCTWYAYGRAYEILGYKPDLSTYAASQWYDDNIQKVNNGGGYAYSSNYYAAKLGAVACYENHVQIVEAVNPDGSPKYLSTGGYDKQYGGTPFNNKDGWTQHTNFFYGHDTSTGFKGYIYLKDFGEDTRVPDPVTDLKCEKYIYNTNEQINFTWNNTRGAHEYWVYLWKDGKELYGYNCGGSTFFSQAPSSPGKYTLIIRPENMNGFNNESVSCSYIVTDEVPEAVYNLRSEKKVYSSNEYINFQWDVSYGAETYWVYLWKDGKQLYAYECGNKTSFTSAPTSPGEYTLIIRPGNINGFNDESPSYSFVVNNGFEIKYDANGGTGAPSTQTKIFDTDLTLSSVRPTRNSYTFLGWSTSSSANSAEYSAGDIYSENKDVTLYAVWQKNDADTAYTLTYDANGGVNAPADQTGANKYKISSVKPIREGYTFLGWSNSSTATSASYAGGLVVSLSSDMTLYAVWQKDTVVTPQETKVSIRNNSGLKTINYGETLRLTAITENKFSDTEIWWYVDGVKMGEGETFEVSPTSGSVEVTVKLVDVNGNVLKDANNNEIADSETVSVNSGIFQIIISFFKNLFGISRTVVQIFKAVY